ncbi:MAG: LysR family transcriptional regulator [Pseudotabrizicola sp.]|uniref:LysR family transcriptional regulator n=1 Tax=Pseudotabrizicola sp. TaxID=2939647 RepID=UPI00272220BE|nr:LysR family transcriptional regulator [Pseudotabrizicola sp.]MDO8882249.1 LysR family transcriptional regulator [Pseudotabrizicola sp.]MDP2082375.1 LysR family transcriptional regulator [Pseudotabrizicola sp.]MDZ7574298.1 LysR family transcriptional regulator [Pseudotabrizicola sp.]
MSYVNTIRMFVRVYELGSMSAAARDQRASPAVASARISELEKHLGVRLFNRTTRSLQPTENGRIFYEGAIRILEAIEDAESAVMDVTQNPRGTIFVAAPLGIGRRFIAPHVPPFKDMYPQIDVRLRLSDRGVDVVSEGIDVAFHLGILEDSTLKVRLIADCQRVLCAAPDYIARRGMPEDGAALLRDKHDCLNLRFPGAKEFQWTLITAEGARRYEIAGPYESDDGDVLTHWALAGRGIVMKPQFEVADHLRAGNLVPVATATPPISVQLSSLSQHRRLKDPKVRLFTDYMAAKIKDELRRAIDG